MKIKELTYQYPKSKKNIFNKLSMDIRPNTINILLGMNGAGKTTLFDFIAGLLKTDAKVEDPYSVKDIVYQIQGVPILNTIRGKDYADLILGSSGQLKHNDLCPALFTKISSVDETALSRINDLWDLQYGKMSPGERRWFTILLYCLMEKSLYIFDEPTAGLDPYSKMQIIREINHLKEKNHTILYATHQINELRYFDTYIVHVLSEGKITLSEPKENWIKLSQNKDSGFLNAFLKQK